MATTTSTPGQDSRARATAIRQALELEEQKNTKDRVLDLILEAYDLPTDKASSPAAASSTDVQHFKTCLNLFQPSDFDDLVRERNIDDRCGYALCSNVNKKVSGGNKVWNRKSGAQFRMVDRSELEKWCSTDCGGRAAFVRAQLRTEPAWLRDAHNQPIKLLDEVPRTSDLTDALEALTVNDSDKEDLNAKLKALSLERGEPRSTSSKPESIAIIEKTSESNPPAPSVLGHDDTIEGYQTGT